MYILGAIAVLIVLLLSIRVTLNIVLRDELAVYVRCLFIRIRLFPPKEKKFDPKKQERKQKKKENKPKTVLKEIEPEGVQKSSLTEKIKLVTEIVSVFFKTFSKYLHVKLAKVHVKVASDDAAKTAILYGVVSGAISCLVELLDSITNLNRLKRSSISVYPDYLSENVELDINISLSISVFGALVTLIKSLWKFIMLKYIKK